jgi:4-amino-4-deoxy-L-arabinose transferase-like glycosyltransferase
VTRRWLPGLALVAVIGWFLYLPLHDILTFPRRISVLSNLETDAAAYDAFARDFAQTWQIPSLPSKHPPGWMVVLAGVYATVGHSYVAGKLVSWVAMIVTVAAAAWIANRVFGRTAAAIAALLCASSPGLRGYVGTLQYEVLTGALFAVFLMLVIRVTEVATRREAIIRAVIAGSVGAALVLTRETFVLVVPIAAWWMWRRTRPSLGPDALRAAIVIVSVAAAPAMVWSAAQTLHYQRLILISEKGPKEFELGNNPLANGTYNEPLVGMGEPAGVAFIRAYPADALRLAGRKVLYMFGVLRDGWNVPHPLAVWVWRATTGMVPFTAIQPLVAGGWLLILCIAAMFLLGRSGIQQWWVLLATGAAILLVHVITIGSYRFAIPLLPLLYVLASGPLAGVAQRTWAALRTPSVAIAAAILLSIAVAAQFQQWPLSVTYAAANLEGINAANQLDEVSRQNARVADAERGERPFALLPDIYLPRGTVRVSARLRVINEESSDSVPVARMVLLPLDGRNPCAADVFAAQLSTSTFADVPMLCELEHDGPATLAVFSRGTADLALDHVRLTWTNR